MILLSCIYFLSLPPPHRRHRARSLPVPRGSMHTGGFLSRLALSGAEGQNNPTPCETRSTQANKLRLAMKASNPFCRSPCKTRMNVQLYSLFQDTHFAWRLLSLFVLIDKKLRQFLRVWRNSTSSRPNRGDQVSFSPQMVTNMLFSNSRNQSILPPLNTQAPT